MKRTKRFIDTIRELHDTPNGYEQVRKDRMRRVCLALEDVLKYEARLKDSWDPKTAKIKQHDLEYFYVDRFPLNDQADVYHALDDHLFPRMAREELDEVSVSVDGRKHAGDWMYTVTVDYGL